MERGRGRATENICDFHMNDRVSCDDDVKRCECNTFQQNEARDLQADFMLHVRAIKKMKSKIQYTAKNT